MSSHKDAPTGKNSETRMCGDMDIFRPVKIVAPILHILLQVCRLFVSYVLCLNYIQKGSTQGGVAVIKAVKILALPGRGGSDPCQDLFGGFDIVNWGQPKVIMDPQK